MLSILLALITLSVAHDPIFSQFWPLTTTTSQQGFVIILYSCFPNIEDPSEWWLCLANLDNRNFSQPIFNVRAVLRATLQGAQSLKSVSATVKASGEALFVTHSNQGRTIFLHSCGDTNCTRTSNLQLSHKNRFAFFPRLKLDAKQRPLIAAISVDDNNQASLSLIECSDQACSSHTSRDLFDYKLPNWSPNLLISLQFTLTHDGAPLFVVAYNTSVMSFECDNIACHHPQISDLVAQAFISDAHCDNGVVVTALDLDSLEVISLDSEKEPIRIPMSPFEAISVSSQNQSKGFKIATSRWDPTNQSGIIGYVDCVNASCDKSNTGDLDRFQVDATWFPSVALAEGEPGDAVIFYFKFGELGLYSQVCHTALQCASHKLHDGLNITMNSDQQLPSNFWNSYWALILFVVTATSLLALFTFVRRTVNHVRRIEYVSVQTDQEQERNVV